MRIIEAVLSLDWNVSEITKLKLKGAEWRQSLAEDKGIAAAWPRASKPAELNDPRGETETCD